MDLETLRQKGGIVTGVPRPVVVKWKHEDAETGEETTDEFTVHIVPRSFGAMERLYMLGEEKSRGATLISTCVRLGKDGEQAISYADAERLDPGLAAELIAAINRANAPKKSKPPTKSGTSSS